MGGGWGGCGCGHLAARQDEEAAELAKSRYALQDEDKFEKMEDGLPDGGFQLTGFNMDDELETGYLDAQGNYHENKKDENAEADAWLDGTTIYAPKEATAAAAAAQGRANAAAAGAAGTRNVLELYTEMLPMMHPGETVNTALRRLGGKAGTKRKWRGQAKAEAPAVPTADTAALKLLTGLADEVMGTGNYDVYAMTREQVEVAIKTEQASKLVMFEFKWENADGAPLHTASAAQMHEWSEQGYFKSGVFCRQVKKGGEFHNSRRMDFELFID